MPIQIVISQRSIRFGHISPLLPVRRSLIVLVHATPELFDSFLIRTEDNSLKLFLTIGIQVMIKASILTVIFGQRADLMAENGAFLVNLPIFQLFQHLLLPILASIAVHCVEELSVRADSTDINA